MAEIVEHDHIGESDIAHQARRFRVVMENFDRSVKSQFAGSGLEPMADRISLAAAFAAWREDFDAAKSQAQRNRADFVVCAAGLMLKQLLIARPLKELSGHKSLQVAGVQTSWPEGRAYVNFCLTMAEAVLQDMSAKLAPAKSVAEDPDFWKSFHENAEDNVSTAPGFFDMLFGIEPDWTGPDMPAFRPALRAAPDQAKLERG